MSTTQGFELVAEVQQSFILQVVQAAYDSSKIPHSTPVPPGTAFGPYQVSQGTVNIPRTGLGINMVPAQNSVQLVLGNTEIQVQIANPPIPSASMFDMFADIDLTLPVGTLPNSINVGVILTGLPRSNVTVNLTSGDPVGPLTLTAIQQYVDAQYQSGAIPHSITKNGVSFGAFTADAAATISDDPTDPANQIDTTQPSANQVKVSIPIHLKLVNIETLGNPVPSPIGVQTRIDLTAPLIVVPGSITAKITQATIAVEAIAADPAVADNQYATDKSLAQSLYGINLDDLLSEQIQSYAAAIVAGIGDINVVVPTQTQIETFIGDQVYADLTATPNIGIWTPNVGSNTQVTVNNVTPQVLSDALAICINSESGANPSALTNFIPAGDEFALAVDGPRVLAIIQQTINEPQSQGGLGGIPTTLNNVDGHTVNINSMTTTLQEGSIHFEGNVTVVNAIAGHIDVSADFHADAGMTWVNNSDGSQSIQPTDLGSGVSLSVLAWILSLLLGFISGGLIGGVIAIVVMVVASNLASSIGGAVIQNDITKQITGIGAWPQTLEGIGTVQASFQNPIDIHADCIIFSG